MKPLAVLGTGSDAGKTSVVMALCRIFADQGFHVAPFKAQNVSNNSAVTHEGREISRAQCLQAEAARVEPSYLFNPVLIKSHGNGSVQVIVNGLVHKQQTVTAYYDEIDHFVFGRVCFVYYSGCFRSADRKTFPVGEKDRQRSRNRHAADVFDEHAERRFEDLSNP